MLPVFTLADLGVDKKLSARSQRLAALPGMRFEIVTQRLLSFPTKVAYESGMVVYLSRKFGFSPSIPNIVTTTTGP